MGLLGSVQWQTHLPFFMTGMPWSLPLQTWSRPETSPVGHFGSWQIGPVHPSLHLHEHDAQVLLLLLDLQMHSPFPEQGCIFSSVGHIGVLQSAPVQPLLHWQVHLLSTILGTPLQLHCFLFVEGQMFTSQALPTHPALHSQVQPVELNLCVPCELPPHARPFEAMGQIE